MRPLRIRLSIVVAALATLAALSCSTRPQTAFLCGGFGGAECPPASSCQTGSCKNASDCGDPCFADVPCEASSECPAPTRCDTSVGYCMPRTCTAKADCEPGELCVYTALDGRNGYNRPICMVVPNAAPSGPCPREGCPVGWRCETDFDGSRCHMLCQNGECPGALRCSVGGECV